jgi:hypothetical protein
MSLREIVGWDMKDESDASRFVATICLVGLVISIAIAYIVY